MPTLNDEKPKNDCANCQSFNHYILRLVKWKITNKPLLPLFKDFNQRWNNPFLLLNLNGAQLKKVTPNLLEMCEKLIGSQKAFI